MSILLVHPSYTNIYLGSFPLYLSHHREWHRNVVHERDLGSPYTKAQVESLLFSGIWYWELRSFHSKLKLLRAWVILKLWTVWASVKYPCSTRDIKGGMIQTKEALMISKRSIHDKECSKATKWELELVTCLSYLYEVAWFWLRLS